MRFTQYVMAPRLGVQEVDLDRALENAPTDPQQAVDVVVNQAQDIYEAFLRSVPLIVVGAITLVVALMVALAVARAISRALMRSKADRVVVTLISKVTRLIASLIAVLFALSVAGVPVGSVLAGLAVLGIAVGLAVQGILENFIAGVILLIRKPFRSGDQIITGDFEGTVEEIDLRVTKLIDYDGETLLIPNKDVYNHPLTNLTGGGKRRTRAYIGVDYRDDHDRAREIILGSVGTVEGVLDEPAPEVVLLELGDSSVDFEIRYWTKPDMGTVVHTRGRVLSAAKHAIEDAGMTIPWPIRTLAMDAPLRMERD